MYMYLLYMLFGINSNTIVRVGLTISAKISSERQHHVFCVLPDQRTDMEIKHVKGGRYIYFHFAFQNDQKNSAISPNNLLSHKID